MSMIPREPAKRSPKGKKPPIQRCQRRGTNMQRKAMETSASHHSSPSEAGSSSKEPQRQEVTRPAMPQEGVVLSQLVAAPASREVPPKIGLLRRTGEARGSASDAEKDPVRFQAPATPKEEPEKTELNMIAEGESRRPQSLIKTAVKMEIEEKQ